MKKELLLGGLMIVGCISGRAQGKVNKNNPSDRPNIIYILADDLGYGDLSCYGQKKFRTPNIDKLAKEGIKFTNHYAGCSVSAPSRCSLLTGMHTGHTPIRGNKGYKTADTAYSAVTAR